MSFSKADEEIGRCPGRCLRFLWHVDQGTDSNRYPCVSGGGKGEPLRFDHPARDARKGIFTSDACRKKRRGSCRRYSRSIIRTGPEGEGGELLLLSSAAQEKRWGRHPHQLHLAEEKTCVIVGTSRREEEKKGAEFGGGHKEGSRERGRRVSSLSTKQRKKIDHFGTEKEKKERSQFC